jgi:hypothetical protein
VVLSEVGKGNSFHIYLPCVIEGARSNLSQEEANRQR